MAAPGIALERIVSRPRRLHQQPLAEALGPSPVLQNRCPGLPALRIRRSLEERRRGVSAQGLRRFIDCVDFILPVGKIEPQVPTALLSIRDWTGPRSTKPHSFWRGVMFVFGCGSSIWSIPNTTADLCGLVVKLVVGFASVSGPSLGRRLVSTNGPSVWNPMTVETRPTKSELPLMSVSIDQAKGALSRRPAAVMPVRSPSYPKPQTLPAKDGIVPYREGLVPFDA